MPPVDFRRLPAGSIIGPYRIEAPVGSGAFATVYRAVHRDGTERALKVRRAGDASLDRRFLREFESMRTLRIPGVVRVYEAGQDADLLWFAMDLVNGQHFDKVVQRMPTHRARARLASRLGVQLLQTLTRLHSSGIIHRDVKPSNILVDDKDRVHVLDFGIVRFFGEAPGHQTTSTGEIIGTVPFMAPEQLAGLPIDERIDVFAAGILLYEAVAGKRERPRSPLAWIPRTCLGRPVPLASCFAEVSRGLSHAIERMLDVDPAQRPSAAEAAIYLRNDNAGRPSPDWPEPPFVSPGDWFEDLLGCIGDQRTPHVQVLSGPAGSGKRRLAEQVQREGLVQGVWTVHSACRRDRVGGPVGELIDRILRSGRDDEGTSNLFQDDAAVLRRMWPQARMRTEPTPGPSPDHRTIARAVTRVLQRLSAVRPMLWVVRDVHDIDPLTTAVVESVQRSASPKLGLLLLVDPRWSSPAAASLVDRVVAGGARLHEVEFVSPEVASQIANELVVVGQPLSLARCRPQHAIERGLAALAAWRQEPYAPPASRLWPLVLLDGPIPSEVLRRLSGGSALGDAHVHQEKDEARLVGRIAATAVRARLSERRNAANALLRTWRGTGEVPPHHHAALRLLSDSPAHAFPPVARAAIEAARLGNYGEAREHLLVLDTLPPPTNMSTAAAYAIARVRARTALRTEATLPRHELADDVAVMARTPIEKADAQLIRAEYMLRQGQADSAVVAALRVASSAARAAPQVAVRALLVATQARAATGRLDESAPELARAESLLRKHPDPVLAVQCQSWRGELALHGQDIGLARDISVQAVREAATFGYTRGRAFNAARLGHVLRMAGRRREAEQNIREALDAFALTGDVALHAEARLLLATLLAERGDAISARHLLDETLRTIRRLRVHRLVPVGLRVALVTATQTADANEASMALHTLRQTAGDDPELPAAIVRWWRSRGDLDQAGSVEPPSRIGYGLVCWRIEQARIALASGDAEQARVLASQARHEARAQGFRELSLYATLVLGGTGQIDETWDERQARAAQSLDIDVYLGALEMEARRRALAGDVAGARASWKSLALRANDLGHLPVYEEAMGWLEG